MIFYLPTEIYFGQGQINQVPRIIEGLKLTRPLLISDKGVAAAGHLERLGQLIPHIDVFLEIEPNPRHLTINYLAEKVRSLKPDLIIGLGGGSVLDAAKALALLSTNSGRIEDYEGKEKYRFPPLPMMAIPTTCGTGSEVSWVAVITHTEKRFKISIKGKGLFPLCSILDPDLLITLPPSLVASTGLDALTHALEAAIVKAANDFSDLFASKAISLIFDFLPRAYSSIKDDSEAREKMLLASLLAGVAFGQSDVGAIHCLSEALGGLFDIPHGMANALFLPFILEYMRLAAREKLIKVSSWAGIRGDKEEVINLLIQKIKNMAETMKIPSLKEWGIKEKDFSEIAKRAVENNSNPSNPREMTEDDYCYILRKAYED